MEFLREVHPGCDGLKPAGELQYGIEYRQEFAGGVVRRFQAVMCATDFHSLPIDQNQEKAREILTASVGELTGGLASAAEEFDELVSQHGCRLVTDRPQEEFKLWQLVVRTRKPAP